MLNLSNVSFCDSAGLNVLLGAWRQAAECGVVLVLACVPEPLRRILQPMAAVPPDVLRAAALRRREARSG
ncbi:STAS domain-containing protein [Streptomyces albicerus]|uniref:STAS domain-containing protein n=1 Tax=Streptomyces albicerus TaxID=2569859 RepID=UPI001CECF794